MRAHFSSRAREKYSKIKREKSFLQNASKISTPAAWKKRKQMIFFFKWKWTQNNSLNSPSFFFNYQMRPAVKIISLSTTFTDCLCEVGAKVFFLSPKRREENHSWVQSKTVFHLFSFSFFFLLNELLLPLLDTVKVFLGAFWW